MVNTGKVFVPSGLWKTKRNLLFDLHGHQTAVIDGRRYFQDHPGIFILHGLGGYRGALYVGDNGDLTADLDLGLPVIGGQDMGGGQDVGFSLGSQSL